MECGNTIVTGSHIVASAVALLAMIPSPAAAQKDYRALDDGRPVITQDAYPVERGAFEFTLPVGFAKGGAWSTLPELAWGATWNAMIGVKAPVTLRTGEGEGLELDGVGAFAMYNFNTESRTLPALALRGDLSVPAGEHGDDGVSGTVTLIATRSFGVWRTHLNLSHTLGDPVPHSAAHPVGKWQGSFAVDHSVWRKSLLLVADVVASDPGHQADIRWSSGAGLRWQWTPTWVIDLGGRWLSDDDAFAVAVGFSYHFGIAALMKGGAK